MHPTRGILVQLVICMSPGHPKIKIANFMKYISLARFLPLSTIAWLKNIFGNLIAQLTNVLWPIHEKVMSRGHTEKMYSLFGHEKVFLLLR